MDTSEQEVMKLMEDFMGFAEQMLVKHGEFFPYGAAMKPDKSNMFVAQEQESERPLSQVVIDGLNKTFLNGASLGIYDATALFFDTRITLPESNVSSDAIAVQLDHRDRISTLFYMPYALKRTGLLRRRTVEFGNAVSEIGQFNVFHVSAAG